MKQWVRNHIVGLTTGCVLLSVLAWGWIAFEEGQLPLLSGIFKKNSIRHTVRCNILSNVDASTTIKVDILIPCRDKRQEIDLARKLSRIKSDLLTTVDPVQLKQWVVERNFAALKKNYLKVINRISDQPVQTIYFDSINFY